VRFDQVRLLRAHLDERGAELTRTREQLLDAAA
jgi:hypothetical protein